MNEIVENWSVTLQKVHASKKWIEKALKLGGTVV